MSTAIVKQVLLTYQQNRDNAHKVLSQKTQRLYQALPRIQEIDEAIASAGLFAAKSALNQPQSSESLSASLKQQIEALTREKQSLLAQHGYPPDYLKPAYACSECNDTGYIGNKKCSCYYQSIIEAVTAQSNLKEKIAQENFDNFDIRFYSDAVGPNETVSPREHMKKVLTACVSFASGFGKSSSNLLLYGKSGLGKTYLCHCIAKDVLERGHSVVYTSAFDLFKRIENIRFNKTEDEEEPEYLDYMNEADLLIIDDLGSEFSTILTSAELFNIINNRLSAKRPTIISTNLSPDNMIEQYSDRTVSRLLGHYTCLRFFGDDIRLLKKYGRPS